MMVVLACTGVVLVGGSKPASAAYGIMEHQRVAYGSSPLETMNVFSPVGAPSTPMPAVIFVHGGSWRSGGAGSTDQYASAVAAIGWVGFSINYDFNGYPGEVDDVLNAVAWVRSNAAAYDVNPNDLALLGESAGGNLAALAATDATALGGSIAGVRAVVTWSGPMDLNALVSGPGANPEVAGLISNYLGCSVSSCPSRYAQASPITAVSTSSPPFFMCNSTHEFIPLSQPLSMESALHAAGVTAQVHEVPGTAHAAAYAALVFTPSIEFLTKYLGPYAGSIPAVADNGGGGLPVQPGGNSSGTAPPPTSATGTSIPSTTAPPTSTTTTRATTTAPSSASSTTLILILVGILVAAFLIALMVSALRKRRRQQEY
jgi:pectinesterase